MNRLSRVMMRSEWHHTATVAAAMQPRAFTYMLISQYADLD